jgi:hypothetical protein
MSTSRPIHCLFYSHVWSIYQLEALGLIKAGGDLLVEMALESKFAPVFARSGIQHKGITDVLQLGFELQKLAYQPSNINNPIILAPNPLATADVLIAALALVKTVESPIDSVTVLIHINDALQFVDAYPLMTDYSIVWDVADFPNAALLALTESLAKEECLSKSKWKGFHLCNHPSRQLPDIKARESILRNLLKDFPALSPA